MSTIGVRAIRSQAQSDLASLKTAAKVRRRPICRKWFENMDYARSSCGLDIHTRVRTDASGKKQQGITFLLIPMDQPGVEVTPIHSMSGDHEVNQVFFTDAVTSVDNRIGAEGAGWTIAKFLLENERGGSCYAPRLLQSIDRLQELADEQPSGVNGSVAHDPRFQTN